DASWPDRLGNWFLGGLAVRVERPGPASRRRYLLDRARAKGVRLAAEAVDALAEAADGYRALDGGLARLALTARVERRPLDAALVAALLADDATPASGPASAVTLEQVAPAVAQRLGVPLRDLRSPTRRQAAAGPRH